MPQSPDAALAAARKYRYFVCLVIFLAYIMVFFHRLCPAVIALDMQKTFGVSGTLLGLLGSAYFYPYAIMQIPTGMLADSWGPRKTVSSFFVLAGVGSLVMGLSEGLAGAMVGRVLVGVGVSTVFVCNFKLLAEWFSPRRFVLMGGLFMATGGLGAFVSAAPLAWLSDLVGWRMSLGVIGVITIFLAGAVWLVVRDNPQQKGWPALRPRAGDGQEEKHGLFASMKMVASSWRFWPLALYNFLSIGLSFALGGLWGGPYLMNVAGLSKTAAGGVLSGFAFSLILGAPALAWAANRFGRKPVLVALGLIFTAFSGLIYLVPQGLPPWILTICFFFFGLCGAAAGPVIAAVAKESFPVSIAGISVGLINLFPFFGGAVFQVVMGWMVTLPAGAGPGEVVEAYRNMFLFCLVAVAFSTVCAFMLAETRQKAR